MVATTDFLLAILLITYAETQLYSEHKSTVQSVCPQLYHKIFWGFRPRANTSAGTFKDVNHVKSKKDCVYACCYEDDCNVAFMPGEKCYHITCVNNTWCIPSLNRNAQTLDDVSMVLVRPTLGQETWDDVLREHDEDALEFKVKLSVNKISLNATVTPLPDEEMKFVYKSILLNKPESSNAVKKQNKDILNLSKLTEELNTSKVNLTVLQNKPPQIVIKPTHQLIRLPKTRAVLDASLSTDDDGIVSYHWELQQGPVGYQPQFTDTPTLELKDLSRPGNYKFKLTVIDTNKVTSMATANITVLKMTDYPPDANAGPDVIVYLPQNQITLNGSLSADDNQIISWKWTKSLEDSYINTWVWPQKPNDAKPVDMQGTRTPYLHLSNLEEGLYTFQLKVTDSANQSSTARARVFVKPLINQPPIAITGGNITINLPQTWVVVDGSNSTDDNKITTYKWEQIEGPANVVFVNNNASSTNVTGLIKGNYVFKLTVGDESNYKANILQYIIVNQNKNQKPIANAGSDHTIQLPQNAIYINGSKSSDDRAIVKWKWTRIESSLAFGKIVERSDESSILILTDIVAGKYIFNLTVSDEQGLTDTDTVTITVDNDPKLFYLVDLIINVDVNNFTLLQYNTLKEKLALLVQENTKLQVRELKSQVGSEKAIIRFYVEKLDQSPLDANVVVKYLQKKLRVDASLLGFLVNGLQTTICQNN